ncbi:hypothetical protein [Amantichitinum ursilacus]|uniref:Uncharacterized protein n=1 Tax=Amantichitinum ursilacus TaxID=857265 RepID=A0A0N0GRD9_9NEIS|nr:hypothetical protein [Amantichitinum ursilacus]KPC55339.1 hypothetical protein WG78_01740 [Amantichitinum ursilacus]
MRKSLLWSLILTIGASVWTLWSADRASEGLVAPVRRTLKATEPQVLFAHEAPQASAVALAWPAHWAAPEIASAVRNPFDPVAEPTPKPTRAPIVTVTGAPPPPPAIPAVAYRLVGKMMGADGRPVLYLQRDNQMVEARMGDTLSDGYTVESVGASSVTLIHTPSGTHATLDLPEVRD